MEVSIFIDFLFLFRDMGYGYIEVDDMDHLVQQSLGGGIFDHPLWRESYYFNMTDERSGITLITTIGMLPNKKRTAGFILLLKDLRTVLLKPLVVWKTPVHSDCSFKAKDLEYSVHGVDWRIRYHSRSLKIDIRFRPINKIFRYAAGDPSDKAFERIGTQHYEQSGEFSGRVFLNDEWVDIGPCFGHRDHSWGIRDWSAVDRYRLFCCTFSRDLAFNLWEGSMDGSLRWMTDDWFVYNRPRFNCVWQSAHTVGGGGPASIRIKVAETALSDVHPLRIRSRRRPSGKIDSRNTNPIRRN